LAILPKFEPGATGIQAVIL